MLSNDIRAAALNSRIIDAIAALRLRFVSNVIQRNRRHIIGRGEQGDQSGNKCLPYVRRHTQLTIPTSFLLDFTCTA
jgi:hypothetical protein